MEPLLTKSGASNVPRFSRASRATYIFVPVVYENQGLNYRWPVWIRTRYTPNTLYGCPCPARTIAVTEYPRRIEIHGKMHIV